MKKTKEYRVIWEIDLSANSPRDAAEQALEIHRDPSSSATYFEIAWTTKEGKLKKKGIDLYSNEVFDLKS